MYNSGFIIAVGMFPNPTDVLTLKPFVEQMEADLSLRFSRLVADAGYESEENLKYLEEKRIMAFIKPANYEQIGTKKFEAQIGKKENMKYDRIIAIDPDARESGVAELEIKTKEIRVYKMTFTRLMMFLNLQTIDLIAEEKQRIKLVIEAGWLNESNWHILNKYMTARKAAAIGRSVGMNHQTGMLIGEMSKDYFKLPTELQKPLKKCWKGKDGKITQEEMTEVTGWEKLPRMNQDQRDAVLLAWVCAGYPVRVKPQKPQTTLQKTVRAFDG